jgi:hypothetical protein
MPEMKMDGDDISAMAARRKEGRRKSDASGWLISKLCG